MQKWGRLSRARGSVGRMMGARLLRREHEIVTRWVGDNGVCMTGGHGHGQTHPSLFLGGMGRADDDLVC